MQEGIEGSGKGLTREVSPKRKSPRHSGGLLFLLRSLFFSKTQNFKAERDVSSLFPISESLFLHLSSRFLSHLNPSPPPSSPALALLISALCQFLHLSFALCLSVFLNPCFLFNHPFLLKA